MTPRTKSLIDLVISTLGRQQLTRSQLHWQIVAYAEEPQPLCGQVTQGALAGALDRACRDGLLDYTVDTYTRYFVPVDEYVAWDSGTSWHVHHYRADGSSERTLGANFNEQDALTCAAALNARDRKVRALRYLQRR